MSRTKKWLLEELVDQILQKMRIYHRTEIDIETMVEMVNQCPVRPNLHSYRRAAAKDVIDVFIRLGVLEGCEPYPVVRPMVDLAIADRRDRISESRVLEKPEFTYRVATVTKVFHAGDAEKAREFFEAQGVDLDKTTLKVDVDGVFLPVLIVAKDKGGQLSPRKGDV